MMILEALHECPVIAIVRHTKKVDLIAACMALYAGGVRAVEITLPTPGSTDAIRQVCGDLPPGAFIGAGTVLDVEDTRRALEAGAQFLVTPTLDLPTVALAVKENVPIFPGVFTPTEALTAWRAGATAVKLFPAGRLGPSFLKDLHGPLPQIPVAPTGGITLDNVREWLRAGAIGVGVGSSLVRAEYLDSGNSSALTQLSQKWMVACSSADL